MELHLGLLDGGVEWSGLGRLVWRVRHFGRLPAYLRGKNGVEVGVEWSRVANVDGYRSAVDAII